MSPNEICADMLAQMKVHNDKFMAAFANNDPDSIGPLYTSDCKVMPTGQDVIEGREGESVDSFCIIIQSYTGKII